MRQTELHLTEDDRTALKSFRSKGLHLAREVNRAHILSALDEKVPEALIMRVLGVGRTAIWRTRSAYVEKGLKLCFARCGSAWTTTAVRNRSASRGCSFGL